MKHRTTTHRVVGAFSELLGEADVDQAVAALDAAEAVARHPAVADRLAAALARLPYPVVVAGAVVISVVVAVDVAAIAADHLATNCRAASETS